MGKKQSDKNEVFRQMAKMLERRLESIYGKEMAFLLLIAEKNEPGESRADYVSNGRRIDCIAWMQETVARFLAQEMESLDDGIKMEDKH